MHCLMGNNGPKIDEGRKDLIDPFRANHESLANPELKWCL